MTRRWEVVRQTSHSPDEPVPAGWLGWLTGRCDTASELRAHRLGSREQQIGVFYTSRPAAEPGPSSAGDQTGTGQPEVEKEPES